MSRDNTAPGVSDDTPLPQSYSTFWDATPIDVGSAGAPAAPISPAQADDAYVAFMALSEDGPSRTLQVERY